VSLLRSVLTRTGEGYTVYKSVAQKKKHDETYNHRFVIVPKMCPSVRRGRSSSLSKLMNSIKAGCRGRVAEICVENATLVEFGSTLLVIEPAP